MIDSKTLTYEPFQDTRKKQDPEFEGGDSGALLLATDKSGKKYIVKHNFLMDAGNEFVGCWLAEKMEILSPKAHLLTPNEKFKCPCAVAIEYLDGLVPISEGKYDRYEMAPIFALHNLINGEDGVSVEGLNGHICNYDFAESFSNSSLEMFIAASVIDPSILTSNIEQLLRSFSAALDFADFKYPNYTENHGLDPVKFRELALSAAYKLLEIEDEELVCILDELSQIA